MLTTGCGAEKDANSEIVEDDEGFRMKLRMTLRVKLTANCPAEGGRWYGGFAGVSNDDLGMVKSERKRLRERQPGEFGDPAPSARHLQG